MLCSLACPRRGDGNNSLSFLPDVLLNGINLISTLVLNQIWAWLVRIKKSNSNNILNEFWSWELPSQPKESIVCFYNSPQILCIFKIKYWWCTKHLLKLHYLEQIRHSELCLEKNMCSTYIYTLNRDYFTYSMPGSVSDIRDLKIESNNTPKFGDKHIQWKS